MAMCSYGGRMDRSLRLRKECSQWLRPLLGVVVLSAMVTGAANSCNCDCLNVNCSQEGGGSCTVTPRATCNGNYAHRIPDGPLLSPPAKKVNMTCEPTEREAAYDVTVSWVPGEEQLATQYEVALVGFTDIGEAGFKNYYVLSNYHPTASVEESVTLTMTCACTAPPLDHLKVTLTSVLGPVEHCNFRQTNHILTIGQKPAMMPAKVLYQPERTSDGTLSGNGVFTILTQQTETMSATLYNLCCLADCSLETSGQRDLGQINGNDSAVSISVRDQTACRPYELQVEFEGSEVNFVYLLPNLTAARDHQQTTRPPTSLVLEPSSGLLPLKPSALPAATRGSLPEASKSSQRFQHTAETEESTLIVSPTNAAPREKREPTEVPSNTTEEGTTLLSPSNTSAGERSYSPSNKTTGEVTVVVSPSSEPMTEKPHTTSHGNGSIQGQGSGVAASSKGTTRSRSLEGAQNSSSITSPPATDVDTTTSRSSPGPGNLDTLVNVAIVGAIVAAAIVAFVLAIRQMYRRATHKHKFKPIQPDQDSRRANASANDDDRSLASCEEERPLDCRSNSTTPQYSLATVTSFTKHVVLIYHGGKDRHVRNVRLFKRDLAQRLWSDVKLHEMVLHDVTPQPVLPVRASPGSLKVILILSPGIRSMLNGSCPETDPSALRQFLHDIFQSTPYYYLVLLVKRDAITSDDIRYFSTIFAEVERTYEIRDTACEQLHALAKEISKEGDLTNSEFEMVAETMSYFEPPRSFSDVTSVDVHRQFHKLNDAHDNWSEPAKSVFHGVA